MWHEHPDQTACINALAGTISGYLRARLQRAETCTLAVSGGRSPIPLFQALAGTDIEWHRVQLRLVDERYVPPDHIDSNEQLVRQHLLVRKAAKAPFRGLYIEGMTPTQAAIEASRESGPADLTVLGMGDDGHTASLFAGAPQFAAAVARDAPRYVHVSPPHAPHERVTLSLPALLASDRLLLHIAGAAKRDVMRRAETKLNPGLPISLVAAEPGVFLDVYWHP